MISIKAIYTLVLFLILYFFFLKSPAWFILQSVMVVFAVLQVDEAGAAELICCSTSTPDWLEQSVQDTLKMEMYNFCFLFFVLI